MINSFINKTAHWGICSQWAVFDYLIRVKNAKHGIISELVLTDNEEFDHFLNMLIGLAPNSSAFYCLIPTFK